MERRMRRLMVRGMGGEGRMQGGREARVGAKGEIEWRDSIGSSSEIGRNGQRQSVLCSFSSRYGGYERIVFV